MKKFANTVFFAALIVLLFLLTACQGRSEKTGNDGQVKFLIGMSQANLIEPWRIKMNEEILEESAKYKDVKVIFTDAAQDSTKQVKDVEELLQEGIDLLIISLNDSAALTPVVAKAYENIPVIVLDRAVEGYDYTLYIGPDNKLIGKQAGKFVSDLLRDRGGNVVEIQGLSGSPPVKLRSEGFQEAIGQGNIKVIDKITADWQRDKAEDALRSFIKSYPQINVIFAQNDAMALGVHKALDGLNVQGIKIIGIDGLQGANGGLQLVKEGILEGTFKCPTGGKQAVQYAMDILHHERGIPKKIILRSDKITRENVDSYLKQEGKPKKSVEGRKPVLGFAQVGNESMWRAANSESIRMAAKEAGIDLKFENAEGSQERQMDILRSFISQKVDVIAFSPLVETGWDEVLKEARDAGIPVICSDRGVKVEDDTLYTTFIGSDFVEEGRRAARWLVEELKDRDKVNIVELEGTVGSAPAIDRKAGFKEVVKDNSRFTVIEAQSGNFTFEEGKAVVDKILKYHGRNINAVYAHNDDMAFGAIEAIEEYGLRPGKDIIIVSTDGVKRAFREMAAGKMNCTVECNPLLGPQLMKAVKDYIEGKDLPVKIITSEEVFSEETAKRELPNRKY